MKLFSLLTLVCTLFLFVYVASAQAGGGYELTWLTIDGGGGETSGRDFTQMALLVNRMPLVLSRLCLWCLRFWLG